MKKLSAIIVMVLVFAMTVVSASAAGYSLNADTTKVAVGDTITLTVNYTPTEMAIWTADIVIGYDASLVEYTGVTSSLTGQQFAPKAENGVVSITAATDMNAYYENGVLGTVKFTAIADGVVDFTVGLGDGGAITDNMFGTYKTLDSAIGVSVTVGDSGSEPAPEPVFTVDKVVDGSAVKVTVANADKAPKGQIYVATFNGDVLVDCQVQDIANDTLTFSGLAGDLSTAKMFVWDELMIPITYATSAQ